MALTVHSSVPKYASPRKKCHGLFLSCSYCFPLMVWTNVFWKEKGKRKGGIWHEICLAWQSRRINGQVLTSLSSPGIWQAPERVLSISVLHILSLLFPLQCPAGHGPSHRLQRQLYCTKDLWAGALVFLLLQKRNVCWLLNKNSKDGL